MGDAVWLVLLAPLGAAIALALSPRTVIARLGWLGAVLGGALLLIFPPSFGHTLLTIDWIPHHIETLLRFGLRVDPFSAAAGLSLAIGLGSLQWSTPPRPTDLAQLSAAGLLVFAPNLVQGAFAATLVGLLCIGSGPNDADSVRRFAGLRLSDGLMILGLAALYHHAADFRWTAPVVFDSPPAHIIVGLLVAGMGGYLGLLPWPALSTRDTPHAAQTRLVLGFIGSFLVVRSIDLLQSTTAIRAVLIGIAALSAAGAGLSAAQARNPRRALGTWPALIAMLACLNAEHWAMVAVIAWPLIVAMAALGAETVALSALVVLPGALCWGAALTGLLEAGRWLPLVLSAASWVLIGMSVPAQRRPAGRAWILPALALIGLVIVSIVTHEGWLTLLTWPPLWTIPLPLISAAVGFGIGARVTLPVIEVEPAWDGIWRLVTRGLRRLRRPPPIKGLDERWWATISDSATTHASVLIGVSVVVFVMYALLTGGLG